MNIGFHLIAQSFLFDIRLLGDNRLGFFAFGSLGNFDGHNRLIFLLPLLLGSKTLGLGFGTFLFLLGNRDLLFALGELDGPKTVDLILRTLQIELGQRLLQPLFFLRYLSFLLQLEKCLNTLVDVLFALSKSGYLLLSFRLKSFILLLELGDLLLELNLQGNKTTGRNLVSLFKKLLCFPAKGFVVVQLIAQILADFVGPCHRKRRSIRLKVQVLHHLRGAVHESLLFHFSTAQKNTDGGNEARPDSFTFGHRYASLSLGTQLGAASRASCQKSPPELASTLQTTCANHIFSHASFTSNATVSAVTYTKHRSLGGNLLIAAFLWVSSFLVHTLVPELWTRRVWLRGEPDKRAVAWAR